MSDRLVKYYTEICKFTLYMARRIIQLKTSQNYRDWMKTKLTD